MKKALLIAAILVFSSISMLTSAKAEQTVNLLTATYTMMPFEPMDGRKIYDWKKWVWAVPFVALLAIYFALTIFVL